MKSTFIILIQLGILCSLSAQNTLIKINNIENSKGSIRLSVYNNADSFDNEKPLMKKKYSKEKMLNGTLMVKLKLEKGSYGIAVMDDQNNDGEMQYNMLGIPKEGFGFSNFYLTGLNRPEFSDFNFTVSDKPTKIFIKMKYM